MKILSQLKPGLPKRYLLFIAAAVWTFAGSMLSFRGYQMILSSQNYLMFKLLFVVVGGLLFYLKLFAKIALKHTRRILTLKENRPCAFSFFNFKSYLMMLGMITMGITLRKTGWISPDYLSVLYLTMSIPLLLSSIRFYYTGIYYNKYIVIV